MRAVIQRVLNASVSVDQKEVSRIDQGLLCLHLETQPQMSAQIIV